MDCMEKNHYMGMVLAPYSFQVTTFKDFLNKDASSKEE